MNHVKNCLCIFIFLISSSEFFAQDFEGIVHYESTYKSKDSTLPVKDLRDYFGTKTVTYYKNGFYKEINNSVYMALQLWRHDKKAIYYKHSTDKDTLRVTQTNFKERLPFEYRLFRKSDTILGRVCDKLVLKDGYSTRTYYYSPELSLDPKYYMHYDKTYKNAIMEIMQAYYLRLTMELPLFTVDVVATKIEEKELDEETFEIPQHQYLKKE